MGDHRVEHEREREQGPRRESRDDREEGAAPLILKGGDLARPVNAETAAAAARLRESGVVPRLAVVLASDDPAAESYVRSKAKLAAKVGIEFDLRDLGPSASPAGLASCLADAAADPAVHGVILELPLAAGLSAADAARLIPVEKDVDGVSPLAAGLLACGRESECHLPATPRACVMLAESVVDLRGASVVIVGRGPTVGRPLLAALVNRSATVTVCHSATRGLAELVRAADVVFVAAGRPGLVGAGHLRPGQVVIDAGISVVDGSTVGDVDPAALGAARAYTPVPGGVGPLTTALLFSSVVRAAERAAGRVPMPEAGPVPAGPASAGGQGDP